MRFFIRNLILFWFLLTIALLFEYWALNSAPKLSLMHYLKATQPFFKDFNLTTEAGRPISYYLGWAGFCTMLVTNIYILRKRISWMQSWGKVYNWLEFHIFCGLLGPTLIIFHTDFKVGGLVAVSFWSMMIVAGSGIFGRYFYMQVLGESANIRQEIEKWEQTIKRMIEKSGKEVAPEQLEKLKIKALRHVGARPLDDDLGIFSLIGIIISSFIGDMRLLFYFPRIKGIHPQAGQIFCGYALAVRKENYTQPFQKLLGYWHSFHVPFTIVMYITAVIHIIVALLFQSK